MAIFLFIISVISFEQIAVAADSGPSLACCGIVNIAVCCCLTEILCDLWLSRFVGRMTSNMHEFPRLQQYVHVDWVAYSQSNCCVDHSTLVTCSNSEPSKYKV